MKIDRLKYAEWATAILLTLLVLFLLIVRARHAGALWRDESFSAEQIYVDSVNISLGLGREKEWEVPEPFRYPAWGCVLAPTRDCLLAHQMR